MASPFLYGCDFMFDKKALRREISALKRTMTDKQIEAFSDDLTKKFIESDEYRNCTSVYAYLPYNQEVRTWNIIKQTWLDGKKVAVPKVYGDIMHFIWINSFNGIEPGAWSIPEPVFDEPVADDENALILMPGLAFDPEGHRMGYGGGFYDKYLAEHKDHTLIALCYPFQMMEHLDTEAHDVPVNKVIVADNK